MRIVNLASGSKANSTFLAFEQTKILIDVGLTEKQLKQRLEEIGEKIEDILAVCITHEHIDHIRSLNVLAKKYDMDFFVAEELVRAGVVDEKVFKEGKLHKITDQMFNFGDFEILPFKLSHDAVFPLGFRVNVHGSSAGVGFITDTGVVTESAKNALLGTKIVFIESNHDEDMLMGGRYPLIVKKRILSDKGHLSNRQSLDFAKTLYENGTKCFVLSHLSEQNNTPEKAYLNYADFFESRGFLLDRDVFVRLSYQSKHSNNFNLKEDFNGKC